MTSDFTDRVVDWPRRGYVNIEVLPQFVGLPLDDLLLGYLRALRPSAVRVVAWDGETKTDAVCWRVTVYMNRRDLVKSIMQECEVGLVDEARHGADAARLLHEQLTEYHEAAGAREMQYLLGLTTKDPGDTP